MYKINISIFFCLNFEFITYLIDKKLDSQFFTSLASTTSINEIVTHTLKETENKKNKKENKTEQNKVFTLILLWCSYCWFRFLSFFFLLLQKIPNSDKKVRVRREFEQSSPTNCQVDSDWSHQSCQGKPNVVAKQTQFNGITELESHQHMRRWTSRRRWWRRLNQVVTTLP